MNAKKLTWEEIAKSYDKEWGELVDCDWPDGTPYPRAGVVRVHSPERKEFYRMMTELKPQPEDSAVVFVGQPKRDPNIVHVSPFKYVAWK